MKVIVFFPIELVLVMTGVVEEQFTQMWLSLKVGLLRLLQTIRNIIIRIFAAYIYIYIEKERLRHLKLDLSINALKEKNIF